MVMVTLVQNGEMIDCLPPRFLPDLPVMISYSAPLPIRYSSTSLLNAHLLCLFVISAQGRYKIKQLINGQFYISLSKAKTIRFQLKADMFTCYPEYFIQCGLFSCDFSSWLTGWRSFHSGDRGMAAHQNVTLRNEMLIIRQLVPKPIHDRSYNLEWTRRVFFCPNLSPQPRAGHSKGLSLTRKCSYSITDNDKGMVIQKLKSCDTLCEF